MEKLLRFLNSKILLRLGYVLLDTSVIHEMVGLAAAYRAILQGYLEPGQMIIYDEKEHSIEVVTRH